jgi:hypothetical protein
MASVNGIFHVPLFAVSRRGITAVADALRVNGSFAFVVMLAQPKQLGRHLLESDRAPEPGISEWFIKSHPDYTGHLGPRTGWEFACSEIR